MKQNWFNYNELSRGHLDMPASFAQRSDSNPSLSVWGDAERVACEEEPRTRPSVTVLRGAANVLARLSYTSFTSRSVFASSNCSITCDFWREVRASDCSNLFVNMSLALSRFVSANLLRSCDDSPELAAGFATLFERVLVTRVASANAFES